VPLLKAYPRVRDRSEFIACSVWVAMDDKPSQALRRGRRVSSMWKAIEAVKQRRASVAISAGNTGALIAMSKVILDTMVGISRPAIAARWPTLRGESIVLDVGATIGADAEQLVDFAIMGEAMARCLLNLERPTVGLLNVGVEEVKGIEQVKAAGQLLREFRPADRIYRLRGRRRHLQGHRRRGGDGRLHRQHRAQDGGGHRQADRRYLKERNEPLAPVAHGLSAGAARPSGPCATSSIRAASTAACCSGSTASWSRAMAAPTPSALPRPSRLRFDMAENHLIGKIGADLAAKQALMDQHRGAEPEAGIAS
jgi:hypothetical protein